MTTSLSIITRALRLLGVYTTGETITVNEAEDGLQALNGLVASFSNNRLLLYTAVEDVFIPTLSTGVYTIGSGGAINTVRPLSLDDSSYIIYQNTSLPLNILTREQYSEIAFKTLSLQFPFSVWYDPQFPLGKLTFYPIPTNTCEIHLWSYKPLNGFSDLDTNINLPPGYDDLLTYNLAVRIAPEYNVVPSQSIVAVAESSKAEIKSTNAEPVEQQRLPNAVMAYGGGSNNNWWYGVGSEPTPPSPNINATQWLLSDGTVTYVNPQTFTVSGNVTDTFQPLRRVQITLSSGNIYGTINSSTYDDNIQSTVVVSTYDNGAVDGTISAVYYGIISSVNTSLPAIYVSKSDLLLYAPLDSPAFTGNPTVPTADGDNNTTTIANTLWTNQKLGYYLTITDAQKTYATLDSPSFTGVPTTITPASTDYSNTIPTTKFVQDAITNYGSDTSEWVSFKGVIAYINPGSFTANGNQVNIFQPSRQLQFFVQSGNAIYVAVLTSSYDSATNITSITVTPTNLIADILSVYYGILSTVPTVIPASYNNNTQNALIYAPIASPSFTGTPTAPTPPGNDRSTRLATTAWIGNNLSIMGQISGLGIKGESTGNVSYISISSGQAALDSITQRGTFMASVAGFNRTTDQWKETGGAALGGGCFDGGQAFPGTWYFIYLIQNPTTGVIDAGYSSYPTDVVQLPVGYTNFRYIGMIYTVPQNLSSVAQFGFIKSFGDTFWHPNPIYATPNGQGFPGAMICTTTPSIYRILTAPPAQSDSSITFFGSLMIFSNTAITKNTPVYVGNNWQTDLPTSTAEGYGDFYVTVQSISNGERVESMMNISIGRNGYIRTYAPGATVYCDMTLRGWKDNRAVDGYGSGDFGSNAKKIIVPEPFAFDYGVMKVDDPNYVT